MEADFSPLEERPFVLAEPKILPVSVSDSCPLPRECGGGAGPVTTGISSIPALVCACLPSSWLAHGVEYSPYS